MWRARVILLAITALLLGLAQAFLTEPARVLMVLAIGLAYFGAHLYLNSRCNGRWWRFANRNAKPS
jgi:uncharacterized membrane protein YiaA